MSTIEDRDQDNGNKANSKNVDNSWNINNTGYQIEEVLDGRVIGSMSTY